MLVLINKYYMIAVTMGTIRLLFLEFNLADHR
jgi:hypothetical protein